ncbi:Bifunctional chorismate mutase/prephenate dehydratase [Eubacterium plexicaudatum ASF492]|uniref:Bifunctional chorismate mutase/prephenate dehydratase n=1 Tax=Eubacterium plexicaudatum ASF492 TaxID=1235802 RepID=N2A991_9FIRM|nr:Bifunctional chorismate mutase/prephenate dehydratase [Eubacterium plexicaudatum ASF492]
MKDLLQIRDEIDRVDSEITALYLKRMQLTGEVAEYKIRTGKKVFDKERERQKLEKLSSLVTGSFLKHGIRELFEHIMSISRKRQYQLLTEYGVEVPNAFTEVEKIDAQGSRIVFQGVEGAYAHIAMNRYFGTDTDSFHVESWRDAMEAIQSGRADYAVLPIENSTAGVVAENYDLLIEYDNYIVGEQIIPIRHCLLGLEEAQLSDIMSVYSHPQALAQCDRYLQAHEEWDCATESNTAVAACKVKNSGKKHKAAIASELTAQLYGLKILEKNIQTNSENSTRFIIVTNRKIFLKGAAKMSICLEVKHQSGSLYHALSHIIYNDLNMNFIQSRPLKEREGTNWQYRFFIDFAGSLNDSAVANALRGLEEECESIRVLGNY